uniref:Uncharacterized protein n=1 Tax=viral metagenome TaxID=1070528 RepID=A0A6M3Y5Z4_9ZZZZ
MWECECMGFANRFTCRHIEACQEVDDLGILGIYSPSDPESGRDKWAASL